MDELPELPFEKVLSYLSLEDRLKARAVSRRWYHQINSLKVKTLCYSQRPAGFIEGKRRLVSGALARNFISSQRFGFFFATFRPTILSNLKHFRLCDLRLNKKTRKSFAQTIQSFGQLEQLDIIRFNFHPYLWAEKEFKLTLPMLTGIWLEDVRGLRKLALDAPRLLRIKLVNDLHFPTLQLRIVHSESVEWLMTDRSNAVTVNGMKNLQVLYGLGQIDPASLFSLEQLKEIHLQLNDGLLERLFVQKHRHSRTDLKIYLCGLLLNGPDDPAIRSLRYDFTGNAFNEETFGCLAENPSRLADEVPFVRTLDYSVIERVAAGTEVSLLKRFTSLTKITVSQPVKDTERFLNVLKNLHNIERLVFDCDQPQDLFDRLPEHCSAIQRLINNQ